MAYHLIRELYTINSIKGQFSIIIIVIIICSHSQNVWILGIILKITIEFEWPNNWDEQAFV